MENVQPKLRFREFEGNWSKKTINDLGKIITGSTPSTTVESYYGGSFLFVSPFDLGVNRWINNTKTTLTEEGLKKGRLVRRGSTMFVCIGSTIGKIAQNKFDCISNQQVNSVLPIGNDDDFVYSLLENHSSKIRMLAAEHAVPLINKTTFSKYELHIPSIKEQIKIANFLTAIDEKINLLKEKATALAEYKKGMMQKIFNQELRFKDEFGKDFNEWEEKKLGDFTGLNHGDGDWILSKDLSSNGKYKLIQLGNIGYGFYVEKNLKTISEQKFADINGTSLRKGDLLINRMVDSNLYACILNKDGDFITSVDVCWIRENSCFNNYFMMMIILFEQNQSKLLNLSSGSGRVRISKSNLFNEFKFLLPCLKEQTKISTFFSAIDEKIDLVKTQIEETQEYKKGLLQQMFV